MNKENVAHKHNVILFCLKKEMLSLPITEMKLEDHMLSETSQIQKEKQLVTSFIWRIYKKLNSQEQRVK